MINVIHQMNFGSGWVNIPPPINWKENIVLKMIFTEDFPSATLDQGGFEFVNTQDDKVANNINAFIDAGMASGLGIGEGLPYQIFIPGSPNVYIFQGVLNLPKIRRSCDRVIIPIKYVNAIDWFNTLLGSITFYSLTADGLAAAGILPPAGYTAYVGLPGSGAKYPYKQVPYVCTQEQDIAQTLSLILEEIAMVAALKTAIANTVSAIKRVLADLGVALTIFPANIAGGVISGILDIIGLVGQLAWDVFLIAALIGNIEMLINQYGLLRKYKYAMTVPDLFHSCIDFINNYLGTPSANPITFKSTILDNYPYNCATIMPKKVYKENASNVALSLLKGGIADRGNEVGAQNAYGYYDYNAKRLFQEVGQVFNAKNFMTGGGLMQFEERHFTIPGTYKLPNVDDPGFDYNIPNELFEYNWDELSWYYQIRYQLDSQDERTRIVYTGTSCAISTFPDRISNVQNILPPGGKDIVFPFALAKRKEYLNFMEQLVNDVVAVIAPIYNTIVTVINGFTSSISSIISLFDSSFSIPAIPTMSLNPMNALIGALEVSQDTWNEPKIFIGQPIGSLWYVDPNNGANNNGVWNNPRVPASTPYRGEGYMSAFAMLNLFHCKNLPLYTPVDQSGNPQPTVHDQWLIYKNKKFPMCASDAQALLYNNIFTTADSRTGKFETVDWTLYQNIGKNAVYRISFQYTNNLIPTLNVDGN